MVLDLDQCYYQSLARVRELTTVRAFQAKTTVPHFNCDFNHIKTFLAPHSTLGSSPEL